MTYTATYSPEDNKLRLYASTRLDAETYQRVRDAGFIWAPKQELFVAPMWTPARADLCIELAGDIGDEDTSLVDRAEDRAERFETYSEKRAEDADRAHAAVAAIADNIPLGQPILVGHHSERHARRDAERIQNGMRKAVRMWETSKYWTRRAAGAISAAKYKERPDVRARRIKGLESEARKWERNRKTAEVMRKLWSTLHEEGSLKRKDGEPSTFLQRARYIAGNIDRGAGYDLYHALDVGTITPEAAQAQRLEQCAAELERCERWLAHIANRLAYERAMLDASGYTPPPKPKTKAALPLLNYGGAVAYRNPYSRGEIVRGEAVGMTRAEWGAIHNDYKGTRVSECGTHRVRTALVGQGAQRGLCIVYITDAKQHAQPSAEQVEATQREERETQERAAAYKLAEAQLRAEQRAAKPEPERTPFDAMRESLRAGVQTISAPQLFPTPVDVAAQMADAAELAPGLRILEPSAGTGRLIDAAALSAWEWNGECVAVEHSEVLARNLRAKYSGVDVRQADFLACNGDLGTFDRVLMNPPFENAADVKHILHARSMLRPGGVLVAICANGPRQAEALRPLAETWEPLPPDTFKAQGTGVRTVLLTMRGPS